MSSRAFRAFLTAMIGIPAAHLTGCTPPDIRQSRLLPVGVIPAAVAQDERIVGAASLGRRLALEWDAAKGTARYRYGDESIEVRTPEGGKSPRISIQIHGMKGPVDREFVVATGYDGPISISPKDAEVLGIASAGTEILFVGADGTRETRREAVLRVEIPRLRFSETLPVTWKAPWRVTELEAEKARQAQEEAKKP